MANDMENAGTVELVSSEVTGYVGPDGKFVYGQPAPSEAKPEEVYVQSDEDAIVG